MYGEKGLFPYAREQSRRARGNNVVCSDAQCSPGPWGCSSNAGALDDICVCFITSHHHHPPHPVWFITAPAGKAVYQWSSTYGALYCVVIFRDYCGDWSKLMLPVPSAIKISEPAHRAKCGLEQGTWQTPSHKQMFIWMVIKIYKPPIFFFGYTPW